MIDTHCHLHFAEYDQDRQSVLQRTWESGFRALVLVGCDDQDSFRAKRLAETTPNTFFTIGFHPHSSSQFAQKHLESLKNLSSDTKCVGVGEIGLDYYRNLSPQEDQKKVFTQMMILAKEIHKPMIIHCREASDDMIHLLKDYGPFSESGVMHCFAGRDQYLKDCLELGFYISFAGNLTFANAEDLRKRACEVPLERLLVETDCPYLTPVPFRGSRNEPCRMVHTVRRLAEIRKISFEEMAGMTQTNAQRLFNINL
jgi:TatD DNase family protein